ncbi:hypothetical protein FNV43_RR08300 [Rhamnella rubrinervis]|uniref:DUF4283 domain-containing protein n=1 Tax=Rhamnella rubrinervis TaxID=2594499 RepID=A0A8K0HGI4_9ROSA|nr:hypothetical protein FNV43_RR08300 [Rhamnella rubrinervis]
MCFHIVSFSAQAVESFKGLGQEYQRQVVPEVVHAHLEELLLSKLLWTGKVGARHLAMNSVTGSLSLCLVLSCSGTPTLLCVLLNCFLNSETLASQVGIDSSERFRIRRNEALRARNSFIIQTDAPLSQSSGKLSSGRPSVDEIRPHVRTHWMMNSEVHIELLDPRHVIMRVGVARPLCKYNARVCVEIDLLKPRPNRIWLGMGAGGKWQKIIYERVPKFCSYCMLRGHDNESCRHLLQPMEKEKNLKGFRKPFTKTLAQ